MKVLVCGGRDYSDYGFMKSILDAVHEITPISCLIHGGAKGADILAFRWAYARRLEIQEYMARWDLYGKKAGPIRNKRMLEEGKPELVIAFPGGRGTADMVKQALAAGIKVYEPLYEI